MQQIVLNLQNWSSFCHGLLVWSFCKFEFSFTFSFCVSVYRKKLCDSLVPFFLYLFHVSAFRRTGKRFLWIFHKLLPRTRVTNAELISLDTLEKWLCKKGSLNLKFLVGELDMPWGLEKIVMTEVNKHMKSSSSTIKNIKSLLPQCPWPPDLAGWWFIVRGPTHQVKWSFDHVISQDHLTD